ncbi:hypothetical protein SISSUDRAFT_1056551, partial [Sistotremastrum suecicum HHB10207 ss-3]
VMLLWLLSRTTKAPSSSWPIPFFSTTAVPSCSLPPSLWNALIGVRVRIRLPECELWPPQIAYNPALARNTLSLHPPPSPPTCLWQGSLSFGQNPRRLQIQCAGPMATRRAVLPCVALPACVVCRRRRA